MKEVSAVEGVLFFKYCSVYLCVVMGNLFLWVSFFLFCVKIEVFEGRCLVILSEELEWIVREDRR